jgi:hypothetical protein
MIDRRVVSESAADFRQNGCGHPNERTPLMSDPQDCGGTFGEHAPRCRLRQSVDRLRIENQRFGHALRARAKSAFDGGRSCSSSSTRSAPTPSRSCRRALQDTQAEWATFSWSSRSCPWIERVGPRLIPRKVRPVVAAFNDLLGIRKRQCRDLIRAKPLKGERLVVGLNQ